MEHVYTDQHTNLHPIVLVVLTGALLAPLSMSADNTLLEPLQGCWQGKAIKTPRGPLPYPICFELQNDNTLYGVANLNISHHHWRFYLEEDMNQLSFLSTFAGNETPLYLSASQVGSDHLTFSTVDGQYLQVQVQQQKEGYRFTIKVKGKEHVIIQLVQRGE